MRALRRRVAHQIVMQIDEATAQTLSVLIIGQLSP
jgi:hypothetical protein